MKGIIVVAHPAGAGTASYTLAANCLDKTFAPLISTHTILKKTTNNQ